MSSEQRNFVFSVTFIVLFSLLLATIPAGLQGPDETPDMVTPLSPSLVTDFTNGEDFTRTDFTGPFPPMYAYDLGGRSWICAVDDSGAPEFSLAAKILIAGILWLGQLDFVEFTVPMGEERGQVLNMTEIETDATDGTIRYDLEYISNGNTAGGFVVYWNTTEYSDPEDAWDNDVLYLLHGVGIESTATTNIGALIVSLLLLQLPDVPLLVNALIAVPIWAGVVYIIWYIIKEMIPFI